MIRKLAVTNLVLLSILLASAAVNVWTRDGIAQSVSGFSGLFSSLQLQATNPVLGNDPNDRRAVDISCTTNDVNANSGFTDQNCMQLSLTATDGQNVYGNGTNAKRTFLPLAVAGNYFAAGQKFLHSNTINCYGMGDCAVWANNSVNFAGGPIAGDEGTGWGLSSALTQQQGIQITSVYSDQGTIHQSSCNTVLSQNIVGTGTGPQTVNVGSTTGCAVNDWVVVDQVLPNGYYGYPNDEAVQITAVGVGTITAIFKNNHSLNAPITPATVIHLSSGSGIGQQRVLVNMSQPDYAAGAVSSISNGRFLNGSGASWSAGMVGGSAAIGGNSAAANYGCMALTSDDYSGYPFGHVNSEGTGSATGTTLTITATTPGTGAFTVGQHVYVGGDTGVTITAFGAGTYGATGTYTLSAPLNYPSGTTVIGLGSGNSAAFSGYISNGTSGAPGNILTVTSVEAGDGFIRANQLVDLSGNQETILSQSTGAAGSTGTYVLGGATQAVGTSGSPVHFTSAVALKSYYEIRSVNSGTQQIEISSMSVAGDLGYHGRGVGTGKYVVRPCVEILRVEGYTVIAESTSSTWSANDVVEVGVSPYPDVTGFQYYMAKWNPGGVARGFILARNSGARKFGYGISIENAMQTGNNADTVAWGNAYQANGVGAGLDVQNASVAAINLDQTCPSGAIHWGHSSISGGAYICPNAYGGMDFQLTNGAPPHGATGFLSSYSGNSGSLGPGNSLAGLNWNGVFGTVPKTFSQLMPCNSGLVGTLGTITGGSGYTAGAYYSVPLTGGAGTNAMAYITVAGGAPTAIAIINPGINYHVSDTLSASAANIGGTGSGFSVSVASLGSTEGFESAITDSTTAVFAATISGSGSNHVKAYCNGTNWTVH